MFSPEKLITVHDAGYAQVKRLPVKPVLWPVYLADQELPVYVATTKKDGIRVADSFAAGNKTGWAS
jgi:hypothetical protein